MALGGGAGVVAGEVAHVFLGEDFVAALHLADQPLEGLAGLFRVGDDRVDEVGQVAVDGELDDLRVDENEFQLVGAEAVEQREDDVADADGFAAAGGAGDEGVGGLGEVADDVAAGDVHAEHDGQVGGGIAPGGGLEGAAQGERDGVAVGRLDAHEAFARDGGLDADGVGGEREGEVFFEAGDGLDAHAEAGFDAELGDARADDGIVNEGIDGEAIERGLENLFVGGDLLGRDELLLGGGGGAEQVEGGEPVAGDVLGGEGSGRRRGRRVKGGDGGAEAGRIGAELGLGVPGGAGVPGDGGDVGLAVAGVFPQVFEVVEGVLEAVAVAGLDRGAFLAAGGEFLVPGGELLVVGGERGVGRGFRGDGNRGREGIWKLRNRHGGVEDRSRCRMMQPRGRIFLTAAGPGRG